METDIKIIITKILLVILLFFCVELNICSAWENPENNDDIYMMSYLPLEKKHIKYHYPDTLYDYSKNFGGIFISPLIGLDFPLGNFSKNSKSGFVFGGRLEFAMSSLYPFIIGATVQYQKNNGDDEFKTVNRLDVMETEILSYGISVDFIINKYLKSKFTIPFLTLEIRNYQVTRKIQPDFQNPGLESKVNTFGITGGAGFTLWIFDVIGTYTYAKNLSSFTLKTRFHFPLFKL